MQLRRLYVSEGTARGWLEGKAVLRPAGYCEYGQCRRGVRQPGRVSMDTSVVKVGDCSPVVVGGATPLC
jgi:hypothetical protein